MAQLLKAVELAKGMVEKAVTAGDRAVDATAGNGHDTLFLAKLVGEEGKVVAFDIQEEALSHTRQRLEQEGLLSRVQLVQAGHEAMEEHVAPQVSAVMFNLGYLPGGDHRVITRPRTTLHAIEASLNLLRQGGIVTLVIYSGHEGGEEEKKAVLDYCRGLDPQRFAVVAAEMVNQTNNPPMLVALEKHGGQPFR